MFGLAVIDIIVICIYFLVIIAIGIWASQRIKNQEDYLLGGRKFGKVIQTFASFGQATSADGPVGVATTTFRNGAAGIWSSLLMVFATPLFWITSPWQRRMRVLTMGDFYEERYASKKMAATYALIGTIGMMGLLSVGYTAMNKTILATTPKPVELYDAEQKAEYELARELTELEKKNYALLTQPEQERISELRKLNPSSLFSYINENILVWIVCCIVLLYAVMGGLEAAFYTDMLQGIFIILLSIILIPFSWIKIKKTFGSGGDETALQILHQKLPESFFEIFGAPTLIDFTWYFILTASLIAGITVVTQPNQLVTNAAAKSEYNARFGFVTGGFLKRFCTILWGVLGLSAILLYTGKIQNSDLVWGYAIRDLLGSLKLGLVGLMVASMMAALMSTADALMLTVSGLLVHNIYRPVAKKKSEKHYVWAGRVFGAAFLVGGALIATQFDNILEILKFIWEFFVIFAAAFWLGLKWRRANRHGAWASILVTLLIFYLLPLVVPGIFPSLRKNETLLLETQPPPIVRNYVAREIDVEERNLEIERWHELNEKGMTSAPLPDSITEGQPFDKTFNLPSKTIFWSKESRVNEQGQLVARGYMYPELALLHTIGFDLTEIPYALNESIRMLIRLIFPFLMLIIVALLTPRNEDEITRQFFLKMRTRVRGLGPEADLEDLRYAFAHPEETKKMLLFPATSLELYKWNRQDGLGFLISIGVVFIVIGTLFLFVNVGGS
ncbi:MAG: sodium:solute symporter family protein [Bacteroidales bacterium]|nr:sodium:solute symporter family protein [Bacteroidales bacterium]